MTDARLIIADYHPGGRDLVVDEVVGYYTLDAPGFSSRRVVVRINGRPIDYEVPLHRLRIMGGHR